MTDESHSPRQNALQIPPRDPADDWERIKTIVLDGLSSQHSRDGYARALDEFWKWWRAEAAGDGFTKATVQRYRAWLEQRPAKTRNGRSLGRVLSSSTVNLAISAIRKLAEEAADNGLLDPATAQAIGRVKGVKRHGVRVGNWLTQQQAERMLALPDRNSNKGRRDRALLALLLGCGLRREELASLTLEHIQQRDGRWCIVDLMGKGKRVRTVAMPGWTKAILDRWTEAAGIHAGLLFRSVNKSDRISGLRIQTSPLGIGSSVGMTAQGVFYTVREYAAKLGLKIAPHDLRRSFAKLAHKGHAPLEQIQLTLGHSSIQTTERYLGVAQNLSDAPCDYLGLRVDL